MPSVMKGLKEAKITKSQKKYLTAR